VNRGARRGACGEEVGGNKNSKGRSLLGIGCSKRGGSFAATAKTEARRKLTAFDKEGGEGRETTRLGNGAADGRIKESD